MKIIFIFISRILKNNLKKPITYFFIFLPVFGIFFVNTISNISLNKIPDLLIKDNDKGFISSDYISILKKVGFNVYLNKDINKSTNDVIYITIPKAYTTKILNMNTDLIQINAEKKTETLSWLKLFTNSYFSNVFRIVMYSESYTGMMPLYTEFINETRDFNVFTIRDEHKNKNILLHSTGLLVFFMMVFSAFINMGIIKEYSTGLYERILNTSIKVFDYYFSYLVVSTMFLMTQFLVFIISYLFVFRINLYLNIFYFIIIYFVYAVLSCGITFLIISMVKDYTKANTMMILTLTTMTTLGGCFWDINIMPNELSRLSMFMPPSWFLKLVNIIQYNNYNESFYFIIFILILFVFVTFLLTIYNLKNIKEIN